MDLSLVKYFNKNSFSCFCMEGAEIFFIQHYVSKLNANIVING